MSQGAQRASWPSAAGGKDLRCVRVRHEVQDFRVDDRVQRLDLVCEGKVVQRMWLEVDVREGHRQVGHAELRVGRGTELRLVIVVTELLELVQITVIWLARERRGSGMTDWFPNSEATKRKPDFRIQRALATGTVSKYLILTSFTSSSSCSIVTLKRSPSSLCRRKKNAPCQVTSVSVYRTCARELTFILCMTAATMMMPRSGSSKGCFRRGIGTRC